MVLPGTDQPDLPSENAVVVAVKAEKEISKSALQWALTHIVRPGDFVILLAVVQPQAKGRLWRLWGFPKFTGDCGSNRTQKFRDDHRRCEFSASCSQMALQFHGPGEQNEVNMRIKVLMSADGSPASCGAVAAESKSVGANWVVLDKLLKQQARHCMEELHCNIVLMKRSHAKVLRLNLGIMQPKPAEPPVIPASSSNHEPRPKHSTPIGSPEGRPQDQDRHHQPDADADYFKPSIVRECRDHSSSSSSADASPFTFCEPNPLFDKLCKTKLTSRHQKSSCPCTTEQKHVDVDDNDDDDDDDVPVLDDGWKASKDADNRTLQERFAEFDRNRLLGLRSSKEARDINASVCRTSPSTPPPLCSMCRHKTPVFGKPPRWFSYEELEDATNGFSEDNFVAEGGHGWVHRGVLRDGQVVAVKRFKYAEGWRAGTVDNRDFMAEAEVLSRAQHRNVVLLIGFCLEGGTRILVYEYICNGSLDSHLHGRNREAVDWRARARIAAGAARGLRYLHEDCRVGFVHRDVRPNNILLTHDFEPLVADFGLADWRSGGEARTFGYLAPELIETGGGTEKADVYAFGVVLLELLTGRKAIDLSRPKGQQLLVDWARPVITAVHHLLDPRLDREEVQFFGGQVNATARAASLCLRRDPASRPSMSKVLRILEGDESSPATMDGGLGSSSPAPKGSHSMRFSQRTVSSAVSLH